MPNQQVLDYIKQEFQRGANKEDIKRSLLANNWSDQDIEESFRIILGSFSISIPVKEESGKPSADQVLTHKLSIAEILYYIGGAIVFLGISILIQQNWSTLGMATKILATLGIGITSYFAGVLFSREEKIETLGSAFYLISALVIPIGLYVVFDNANLRVENRGIQTFISGILFITYFLSYFIFRKNIFTLFSILFGTWLFYSSMAWIFGQNYEWLKHFEYLTLAVGLSYIFLGYYFSRNEKKFLTGFLYSFGILGFLGSAFALGGWSPDQNIFWELIFPIFVFGAIFLSIYVKSKSFLVFGSLFLMAYILKITGEYFTSGLGWPLALVIAGFMLIAVGYLSYYLNRKYISQNES